MKSPRPMRAAGWISMPVTHPGRVGERARHERHARLVQRMRDAMREQRLHAAVGGEHLDPADAARGRVALRGRGQVLAQLTRHLRQCPEPEHQGAKKGVLT